MVFVIYDQEEVLILFDCIVLMNVGCIVQSGDVEIFYIVLENVFVVGFIGNYNLFDVEQVSCLFGQFCV